jgi:hypothetical protein
VALFGLPGILRYKAKPGRDLKLLRSELLRLIALLDDLSQAEVPMHAGQNDGLATHQARRRVRTPSGGSRPGRGLLRRRGLRVRRGVPNSQAGVYTRDG